MRIANIMQRHQEVYGIIIEMNQTEGNINYSIKNSKSFHYEINITGELEGNNAEKDKVEIVMPLKYLSNFWRTLDMQLINCEGSLALTWSANCVLPSKATKDVGPNADPAVDAVNNPPTDATFKITDTKLYVPVITLWIQGNNKLFEELKAGFKRTIKWNKYSSEISIQTKNNNLDYLIDPAFTKVSRLFVLSFKNEDDRMSFSKYYTPSVEVKDFNILIDGKSFFDTL